MRNMFKYFFIFKRKHFYFIIIMDYVFNYFSNDNNIESKVDKAKVDKAKVEKAKVENPKVEKPKEVKQNKKPKKEEPKEEELKEEELKEEELKEEELKEVVNSKVKEPKEVKQKKEKIVYYDENDTFDLQILQLPVRTHKKRKVRLKRPIDKRLPNIDNGINMILCSQSEKNNSILIANLIENNQFYKGYFHNIYLFGDNKNKALNVIYKMYHDTSYQKVTNELLTIITKKQINTNKNACIIINHYSDDYHKISKIFNVSSNYRTILNSSNGGGMLLLSNKNYESIPRRLKNSANTFVIGKLPVKDYELIAQDLGDLFNSSEELLTILTENIKNTTDYLILMIEGNGIHQKPCIYKNWEELI